MRFLRFVWKLFVMAAVFGVGYIVGREHSFEEEEQWEAENSKKKETAEKNEKSGCCSCTNNECDCNSGDTCGCSSEEAKTEVSSKEVTFEYESKTATKVALVGSFNKWDKDADPMTKEDSTWKCKKTLDAGTYEYQYVVDDTEWVNDPKAEATSTNKYEGTNSVVIVK